MDQSNVVYVGRKPVMAYCMAVMTALGSGSGEVTLMARGRAISKAVDVAEVVRNQFVSGLVVKGISIDTEHLEGEDGRPRNVSNITIVLSREKPAMEGEDGSEEENGVHGASASGARDGVRPSSSPVTSSEMGNICDRCPGCGATKDYTRTENGGLHWRCSLCGHAWRARID